MFPLCDLATEDRRMQAGDTEITSALETDNSVKDDFKHVQHVEQPQHTSTPLQPAGLTQPTVDLEQETDYANVSKIAYLLPNSSTQASPSDGSGSEDVSCQHATVDKSKQEELNTDDEPPPALPPPLLLTSSPTQ